MAADDGSGDGGYSDYVDYPGLYPGKELYRHGDLGDSESAGTDCRGTAGDGSGGPGRSAPLSEQNDIGVCETSEPA